ncbi:MarR family winged helix-turn-helix transcriptional regulator [Streptomyces zaomyceticus]|uniref:MarR family winged helix-turn-helix transcriptional regulator n=1 Tax=Streptomyces zaomyceticus TaxID=68286 RepID=UPI0036AD852F
MELWRTYLGATTLLEGHLDRQLRRDAGLSHLHFGILIQLSRSPHQRMRMTPLAKGSKITRSRLSQAIARLEHSGLVRREEDQADRRGQNAVLTRKGAELLRSSAPDYFASVRRVIIERFTPDQLRNFRHVVGSIAVALEGKEEPSDPAR